jgi:hypothetical protein
VIVYNEASLYRQMKSFVEYYHESRTHLSLRKDTPLSRSVQQSGSGRVTESVALKARRGISFGKTLLTVPSSTLEVHIQTFCSWPLSAVETNLAPNVVSEKDVIRWLS